MGEAAPGGDASELRVSHRDRDRVVEELRVAAGDGRLTAEELEERVTAALSARTGGELAVLTADLPAEGIPARPKDLIRIDQSFGDVSRTGRWLVPRRMEVRLKFCDAKLDFTEAVISHDVLHIDLDLRIGGNLTLITRPGVVVGTDELTSSRGEVKVPHPDPRDDAPSLLRIELTGRSRGGDIIARPPRRSFGRWLRGRPRDYPALPH